MGDGPGQQRVVASDLRTTPDFILDQPKLQFAARIRNVTPHAVSIPIPFSPKLPQLSDERFGGLVDRNPERVCRRTSHARYDLALPHATAPSTLVDLSPRAPGEDISPEW